MNPHGKSLNAQCASGTPLTDSALIREGGTSRLGDSQTRLEDTKNTNGGIHFSRLSRTVHISDPTPAYLARPVGPEGKPLAINTDGVGSSICSFHGDSAL